MLPPGVMGIHRTIADFGAAARGPVSPCRSALVRHPGGALPEGCAARRALGAATALDRLIDAQHQRGRWCEGGHEQAQQDATGPQARPDGAIEDAVVRLEGRYLGETDGAQGRADHATAGSQDGADDQDWRVAPGPA